MAFLHSTTVRITDDNPQAPYTVEIKDYLDTVGGFPDMVIVSDGDDSIIMHQDMILEVARAIMRRKGIKTLRA